MSDLSIEESKRIAPGERHVVKAGELHVIEDDNAEHIEIEGRESDEAMAVLIALDNYLTAKRAGVTGIVIQSLERAVDMAYDVLPSRIVRELPSHRELSGRIVTRR
jgi:hypothetical protein